MNQTNHRVKKRLVTLENNFNFTAAVGPDLRVANYPIRVRNRFGMSRILSSRRFLLPLRNKTGQNDIIILPSLFSSVDCPFSRLTCFPIRRLCTASNPTRFVGHQFTIITHGLFSITNPKLCLLH